MPRAGGRSRPIGTRSRCRRRPINGRQRPALLCARSAGLPRSPALLLPGAAGPPTPPMAVRACRLGELSDGQGHAPMGGSSSCSRPAGSQSARAPAVPGRRERGLAPVRAAATSDGPAGPAGAWRHREGSDGGGAAAAALVRPAGLRGRGADPPRGRREGGGAAQAVPLPQEDQVGGHDAGSLRGLFGEGRLHVSLDVSERRVFSERAAG